MTLEEVNLLTESALPNTWGDQDIAALADFLDGQTEYKLLEDPRENPSYRYHLLRVEEE